MVLRVTFFGHVELSQIQLQEDSNSINNTRKEETHSKCATRKNSKHQKLRIAKVACSKSTKSHAKEHKSVACNKIAQVIQSARQAKRLNPNTWGWMKNLANA